MNALVLFLVVSSTLVLRSGDRITVEGSVREENGVITFRSEGVLFSVPASEVERVELDETVDEEAAGNEPTPHARAAKRRLKVSAEERKRLLEALSKNRGGVAPADPQALEMPPPRLTEREAQREKNEESIWRRRARAHEEAVRRAIEELELMESREREIETKIVSLIALGYQTHQFTYDTTQLMRIREQLPYARLAVERAQRAYDQFRDDARREGVRPGWLR